MAALKKDRCAFFPGAIKDVREAWQWLKENIGPKCTPVAWCLFRASEKALRGWTIPKKSGVSMPRQDRGREIDGDHGNILNEPQVKQLAERYARVGEGAGGIVRTRPCPR